MDPINLPNIRIITVSGKIASGSTTLAKKIAQTLHWKHIEGGEIFWEAVRKRMGLHSQDTNLRPDEEDTLFDAQLKKILHEDNHIVLETKLAAFNAQGISEVYKIGVICENEKGEDQLQIRIDRLVNREQVSVNQAKKDVIDREQRDLEKWRKLYMSGDENWVYFDKKYYDLVVNTYSHNQDEALKLALRGIGYSG